MNQNLILCLEYALETSSIYKQALKVFENIIMNKQTVSNRVLFIFANNLYYCDNY